MKLHSNWSFPTYIRIGLGRTNELPEVCAKANMKNPLLVTDRDLGKLKITENLISIMHSSNLGKSMFSNIDPNPNIENLKNGVEIFKSGHHDGVIAFGGGSALDLGKLIAFMADQSVSVWEFEDIGDRWKKANSENIFPIIAIPTTAGTGSEVGRASVLTNTTLNRKTVIFHPLMLPKEVICDPQLTFNLPNDITAGTGMDAFAHCLEAFCSPNYHPLADGIAIEGMKLVKENLILAYNDQQNLIARTNMMSAALMGATSFQKGLGAMHALSHPIGAIFNTHHGTTNAILMKHVLLFNKEKIEKKINLLSLYLGISNGFDGFIEFVNKLCNELKIPKTLKEVGFKEEGLQVIAEMAIKDPTASGNPVKLSYENTLELLKKCI